MSEQDCGSLTSLPEVIDLSKAIVASPPDVSGPEQKAVTMLVDEVEKRTRILWERTTTWPSTAVPVIAVGPASAPNTFSGAYAAHFVAEGGGSFSQCFAAGGSETRSGD